MLIEQRIKKALPDPRGQGAWIRATNKALDGHEPLLLMSQTPQSLSRVSKVLESERYN
ncbi:MAG: DUF2384 domain-containing protein [Rhodobacteraceae bacterium]|nr:DUF2384 domain-containing protein [Paracoccaceae bacterium]